MKPSAHGKRWAAFAALAIAAGLFWRLSIAWREVGATRYCENPKEGYFFSSIVLLAHGTYSDDPGGTPQAKHGPLYPTFLALSQAAADPPSPRAVYLAQAVFGALLALAAWGLGARLHSAAAGAFAAAAVALSPSLAASVTDLDIHGFYGGVVLLLACAAAEWAERDGDRKSGALLGAALGVSLLCRSAHVLTIPLLVAASWIWWGRRGLKRAAWMLLVALAVLTPWTLRNYVVTKRLVVLDTGVGAYNLLSAADDRDGAATIDHALALAKLEEPDLMGGGLDDPARGREDVLMRVALRMIMREPLRYARGTARRLVAFWRPLAFLLLLAAFAAFAPGAARGALAAGLVAASFSFYAAIGLGLGYRLGVEPLLAALAGIGLAGLLKPRRRPERAADPGSLRAALPAAAPVAITALVCLAVIPFDAWAVRQGGRPQCAPPAPILAAYLDEGTRVCGPGWVSAPWAGTLRARPALCAGIDAYASGDKAGAVRFLDRAAAQAPQNPEIRVSLAVALGDVGQRARALRECEEAARLAGFGSFATLEPLRASIRSTCGELRRSKASPSLK